MIWYNSGTKESAGAGVQTPPAWHSGLEPEMRTKSIPTLTPAQEERFWSKVEVFHPAGCWEWAGQRSEKLYGYHYVTENGKCRSLLAHRVSFTLLLGEIPAGLVLDHLCRNPSCVNPDHLEPVTFEENFRRGHVRNRAFCRKGHVISNESTRVNSRGIRECRVCYEIAMKRRNSLRPTTAEGRRNQVKLRKAAP